MKFDATSRRMFLRGTGVTLSLPFLHSALPRGARAQDKPPVRFLGYYFPCGAQMRSWTPGETGSGYTLAPTLAPLADVRQKVNVITGLENRPAKPDGPGDHASGTGAFLTVAHPRKTSGTDIQNGISIDQEIANVVGDQTPRLRSLQLGIDGGGNNGDCDSGYSCAYARNISWANATTPLPKLTNLREVHNRLFEGFDSEASSQEALRRQARRLSVLDYARNDAKRLEKRLDARDRAKLDQYLTSLRETERRIEALSGATSCEVPSAPGDAGNYTAHVDLMADLMVTAFQCDITRVMTFMIGNAGSNRDYGFLDGVTGGHHGISHHQSNENNRRMLEIIDHWQMQRFASLLKKMDQTVEADGSTLLDNMTIIYSSEISDGDRHNHDDMPIVLAGGGGGAYKTGQHIRFEGKPSMAQLFVTMMNAMGVSNQSFGDATGALTW